MVLSRVIRQMEHCRSCSGGSRFSPGRAGQWRAAQTRHTAGGGPAPWSRHQREAARAVDRLRGVKYRYGIAMWPLAVLQVCVILKICMYWHAMHVTKEH